VPDLRCWRPNLINPQASTRTQLGVTLKVEFCAIDVNCQCFAWPCAFHVGGSDNRIDAAEIRPVGLDIFWIHHTTAGGIFNLKNNSFSRRYARRWWIVRDRLILVLFA
jgi:hypothetical protein